MTNEQGVQGEVRTLPCWFPACPNAVPQNPNGRAKLTCDQVVDGLRHSRMNKSLVERGKLTVPARGTGRTTSTAQQPAAIEGERPVTTARATMGQLMGDVQTAVAGLAPLVARMEAAARTVADQESVTAEINATERAARRAIDQAEAERDAALTRARAAEAERDAALVAQAQAEEVADTALEAEEVANEARDTALGERDAARAAETGQRDRAEGLEAELVDVRAGLERAAERAEMLVDQVNTAREQASAADRLAGELRAQVAAVTAQRDEAEQRAADMTGQLAAAREQAAQQGALLAAARDALAAEKHYGAQRLADVQALHAETVAAVRADLDEVRRQLQHERDQLATERRARAEAETSLSAARTALAKARGDAVDSGEHQAQVPREAAPEPAARRTRRSGKQQ